MDYNSTIMDSIDYRYIYNICHNTKRQDKMISKIRDTLFVDCESCGISSMVDYDEVLQCILNDDEHIVDTSSPDKLHRSLCNMLGLNMYTTKKELMSKIDEMLG